MTFVRQSSIKQVYCLITRVSDLHRARVHISGTGEVAESVVSRKWLVLLGSFGSPSSTKKLGSICIGHHIWHLGTAGRFCHVARTFRDQINSGGSTYHMHGYPNLSTGICQISSRNGSRPLRNIKGYDQLRTANTVQSNQFNYLIYHCYALGADVVQVQLQFSHLNLHHSTTLRHIEVFWVVSLCQSNSTISPS